MQKIVIYKKIKQKNKIETREILIESYIIKNYFIFLKSLGLY